MRYGLSTALIQIWFMDIKYTVLKPLQLSRYTIFKECIHVYEGTELNSQPIRRVIILEEKKLRKFLLYPHYFVPVREGLRLGVGVVYLCHAVAIHRGTAAGF